MVTRLNFSRALPRRAAVAELQVPRGAIREQFSPSEMTIRKKGHFRLRLKLILKIISCFYLCFGFLSSGKEGSRARILDIILASFEGVYSLDFCDICHAFLRPF